LDKAKAGSEALRNIGAHIIDLAQVITGDAIGRVSGCLRTFVDERPLPSEHAGLSGTAGSGKSAVAQALVERFDRMLHVEVDVLRHFVKAGYRHPWVEDQQAREQLDLAIRNACAITRESIATRYAAVIDDVVAHEWQVARYRELLADIGAPVHLVTLLPRLEVALERDAARPYSIPDRVRTLHAEIEALRDAGKLPGVVLDTSEDPDAELTGDRVQEAVSRGEALFIRGGIEG